MKKERLDILVQRTADVSRSQAQGLILTGNVFSADGERLTKPGTRYPDDLVLDIREGPKYVSRGGEKLEAGLEAFEMPLEHAVAIDLGASTGGFTDCLLQHGVDKVYAVDVGYGQLAWALRQDDRVEVMERTNARNLTPEQFSEHPSVFVADCSFISLKLILPPLIDILKRPAHGVVLIKPQFEAGREQVGKGGVVRDEKVHESVVDTILDAARQLGFETRGVIPSPLLGPAGNREFLAHLTLK